MLPRVITMLLFGMALLFSLEVDAAAQAGRLLGTVAYATPGRPTVARGVRVITIDDYGQGWETRTDNAGNFAMILREGRYRVVAQGAPGYTTYGTVWGFVRANTDSIITPNPLFLVASNSSHSITSPTLSRTMTWHGRAPTLQQNNFALEIAAQNSSVGKLSGTVIYQYQNKNERARGVKIILIDARGQGTETSTDNNGNFVMVLREGIYRVVAIGAPGYTQGNGWGEVRARTDSIINPNPLVLVPKTSR